MSRWFPERATLWVWPSKAEPSMPGLEHDLDACRLPRGSRITCVIAGDGVRWRVVPWNDALTSPAQRQVLAVNCFNEAYGDASRSWTLRVDGGRHGAATLACAIDAALLDQLDALARACGMRLASVQPAFMLAFNQLRKHMTDDTYWFVWSAGTTVTLALMSKQVPLMIRSVSAAGTDLDRQLSREWFSLGIELPRCPVYLARSMSTPAPPLPAGWSAVELPAVDDALPTAATELRAA